jgi:hypothetical protein
MAVASRDIDTSASSDEWKHLYKWVENQTLSFQNTNDDARNPWLMPDRSRTEIIEHIHHGNIGGWMGPYEGMF